MNTTCEQQQERKVAFSRSTKHKAQINPMNRKKKEGFKKVESSKTNENRLKCIGTWISLSLL
jgi:hypothetical protein